MKYMVTFCATDHTVESNPLWHGAFFLSVLNEQTNQVEVTETWGYYGTPSAGDPNHWWTKFKRNYAIDTDFSGTHGWLMHEELRFMDRGHGVHGYTYELSEAQYLQLQAECAKRVADQEAAVRDVLGEEGLRPAEGSTEQVRCYPGEKHVDHVYAIELHQAAIQKRPSRLHPFRLLPTMQGSHNCKSEALDILGTVLSKEQLAPFHASPFPRLVSGTMENIHLHSEGPLAIRTKANKQQVLYRKEGTPGVTLTWTIPPQVIEPRPGSNVKKLFAVDEAYHHKVEVVVTKLQRLEWFWRNVSVPEHYKKYQEGLIKHLIDCYKPFSIVKPKTGAPKKSGSWIESSLSLFGVTQNKEQEELLKHIQNAEILFNEFHLAVVDGTELCDDLPLESEVTDKNYEDAAAEGKNVDCNSLAALANYLSEADQKTLCGIIGRTYDKAEKRYMI